MKIKFLNYVLLDPLEQFLILPLHNYLCSGTFTNVSLTLLLVGAVGGLVVSYSSLNTYNRPTKVNLFITNLAKSINEEYIHHHYELFFPIIYFVFLFLLLCNFCGLIAYSFTVTSVLIITLALSLMLQSGINILGIHKNKMHFLTLFLPGGTPLIIVPFLIIIEIISYLARIISLAVRLFVNMMAGHTLMKILIGFAWTMLTFGSIWSLYAFFPIAVFSAVTCLETLIAFLQTYIFTVLLSIYINDAINLH